MKYLVLEDSRPNGVVRDLFDKSKLDAIVCVSSNEFLTAMNAPGKFDAAIISADSWGRGRAMYDYFGVGPKLEGKRVVFYNADEGVVVPVNGRRPTAADVTLCKPSDIEAAIGTL